MEKRASSTLKQRTSFFEKEEVVQNLNSISKQIIKRFSLNPTYEGISMNLVKKIINDHVIHPDRLPSSHQKFHKKITSNQRKQE